MKQASCKGNTAHCHLDGQLLGTLAQALGAGGSAGQGQVRHAPPHCAIQCGLDCATDRSDLTPRAYCNPRLTISPSMRWCLGHSVPTDGNARHCTILPRGEASRRALNGCPARLHPRTERSSGAASHQQSRKRQRVKYQAAVLSDAATEEAEQLGALLDSSGSAAAAAATALSPASVGRVVSPDDFTLEPGELSRVDRTGACSTEDVFRCASCTEPACQVPLGRQGAQYFPGLLLWCRFTVNCSVQGLVYLKARLGAVAVTKASAH